MYSSRLVLFMFCFYMDTGTHIVCVRHNLDKTSQFCSDSVHSRSNGLFVLRIFTCFLMVTVLDLGIFLRTSILWTCTFWIFCESPQFLSVNVPSVYFYNFALCGFSQVCYRLSWRFFHYGLADLDNLWNFTIFSWLTHCAFSCKVVYIGYSFFDIPITLRSFRVLLFHPKSALLLHSQKQGKKGLGGRPGCNSSTKMLRRTFCGYVYACACVCLYVFV